MKDKISNEKESHRDKLDLRDKIGFLRRIVWKQLGLVLLQLLVPGQRIVGMVELGS